MGKSEKRRGDSWVIMEVCEDSDSLSTESQSSSLEEDSANSVGSSISSSSSDLVEDACSPTSSVSNGALYDLSDLMVNLPIKKGLSRYFEGKSQSFTSLLSVKSIDDLAKRVDSPYRKKMKASKSYGWGLDGQKLHSPKATISKRVAGKGCLISSLGSKKGPSISFCRPPRPLQRN